MPRVQGATNILTIIRTVPGAPFAGITIGYNSAGSWEPFATEVLEIVGLSPRPLSILQDIPDPCLYFCRNYFHITDKRTVGRRNPFFHHSHLNRFSILFRIADDRPSRVYQVPGKCTVIEREDLDNIGRKDNRIWC
jgi:hypothetical protein